MIFNEAGQNEIIFPLVVDSKVVQNWGPTTVIINGEVGSLEGNAVALGVDNGWGGALRVREQFANKLPVLVSTGQQQLAAIARALACDPPLLVADEPTGNLDSKTSVEIMKLFDEIQAAGNTVILVTHEEDIAQYAKRVIRLVDGNIDSDLSK